jgi:hypothetical protein
LKAHQRPTATFAASSIPSPQADGVADLNNSLLQDPVRFGREVFGPIRAIVGDRGVITDHEAMQPLMEFWRDSWPAAPLAVQPATTGELAAVVRVCAATRTPRVAVKKRLMGWDHWASATRGPTRLNATVIVQSRSNEDRRAKPLR